MAMYTNDNVQEGGDAMPNDELISGADAARLLNAKRSEITNYEKRGRLPVARVDWEGNRRKPWYRRVDVMKIAEFRQARDRLQHSVTEGT